MKGAIDGGEGNNQQARFTCNRRAATSPDAAARSKPPRHQEMRDGRARPPGASWFEDGNGECAAPAPPARPAGMASPSRPRAGASACPARSAVCHGHPCPWAFPRERGLPSPQAEGHAHAPRSAPRTCCGLKVRAPEKCPARSTAFHGIVPVTYRKRRGFSRTHRREKAEAGRPEASRELRDRHFPLLLANPGDRGSLFMHHARGRFGFDWSSEVLAACRG